MKRFSLAAPLCFVLPLLLGTGMTGSFLEAQGQYYPGMPRGSGSYTELVKLWEEYLLWQDSEGVPQQEVHPDFGVGTMAQRLQELKTFQSRLNDFAVHEWTVSQQVDFLAVRAKFDQQQFELRISRPWSRDPGFYIDRVLRLTFTELPTSGTALDELERRLDAVPTWIEQARRNLTDVAADYADLALFNLSNADGVGHGYPYRAQPPAGVVGWYEDLLERSRKQQPELRNRILKAKSAIENFRGWLQNNRSRMTARAGVGETAFNWYLKHVKLMPYTAEQIVTLGERELDRLWALYALERHRNRKVPEIELSKSAEEYQRRIEDTDRKIRAFLVDEEIITIPEYIDTLSTNVPWIQRDGGPNFWEQIQFRNPTPDHLHAVIPGHRFDGVIARRDTHPIRGRLTDDARVEGWGLYLEEGMLHAGLLESEPRVRELIYLFGIFRAARMPADVWLQLNRMTASDVADYWMERVPYLDRDVARVDAEIYLRRPPGYGLGYMTGMLQMQRLLSDRKRQLGDDFNLKAFHDTVMTAGRLPLSLIRWELTGLDNEVAPLWKRTPIPLPD